MYCKKCGFKIDEDSEFCKSCGAKQNTEPIKNFCPKCGVPLTNQIRCDNCNHILNKKRNTNIKTKAQKRKDNLITTIVLIIVLGSMLCPILYSIIKNSSNNTNKEKESFSQEESSNETPNIFERDANNGDIEIDSELNLSELGIDIVIMPNTDIEGLKIKLSHYDEDGNLLKTQTKSIGNVKEGVQVEKTISLTEFSMTEIFDIETTTIEVVGGTVPYLG